MSAHKLTMFNDNIEELSILFRLIEETLSSLADYGMYHRHIQAEMIFMDFLNKFLGFELSQQPCGNKGIDLFDSNRGVGFQLTAVRGKSNQRTKIKDTITAVNELIECNRYPELKELYILFLTMEKIEEVDLSPMPQFKYHFDKNIVWNFRTLIDAIIKNERLERLRIDDVFDFLKHQLPVLREIEKHKYVITDPAVKPSCYLFNKPKLPVFPGKYWGLNRSAYAGLYINYLKDSSTLLFELQDAEAKIADAALNTSVSAPERIWTEVYNQEPRAFENMCQQVFLAQGTIQSPKDTIYGFYFSYTLDPGRSAEYYSSFFDNWTSSILKVKAKFPPGTLSVVINLNVASSNWAAPETAYVYHKLTAIAEPGQQFQVLTSENAYPTVSTVPTATSDNLPISILEEISYEDASGILLPFFEKIIHLRRLVGTVSSPGTFWAEFKTLYRLFRDNQDILGAAEKKANSGAQKPDGSKWVGALATFVTDSNEFQHVVSEVIALSEKINLKSEHYNLIFELASSQNEVAILCALKAALRDWTNDQLIYWAQAVAGSNFYVKELPGDPERLALIFLGVARGANIRDHKLRQIAEQYASEYIKKLSAKHFLNSFMSGASLNSNLVNNEIIDSMSFLEIYKGLNAGLIEKKWLSPSFLAEKLMVSDEQSFLCKALLFSFPVSAEEVAEIQTQPNMALRAITGLTLREEIGTSTYNQLTELIRICRNIPEPSHNGHF